MKIKKGLQILTMMDGVLQFPAPASRLGQTTKRLAMCWGVWYDKIV